MSLPAPLLRRTEDLRSADGALRIWLRRTAPRVLVTEMLAPHFTAEHARVLCEEANVALDADGPGPVLFLHLWQRIRSYELKARVHIVQWGLSLPRDRIARVLMGLDEHTPTLVRMACTAGTVPFVVRNMRVKVVSVDEVRAEIATAFPDDVTGAAAGGAVPTQETMR